MLLYIDDVLVIHHNGIQALKEIDYYFPMKADSMGDPDLYLGCKVRKFRMPNGTEAWVQSPSRYIQEVVHNIEEHLHRDYEGKLPKRVSGPFPRDYGPELDVSEELGHEEANYYQSQIGVLRWIVLRSLL